MTRRQRSILTLTALAVLMPIPVRLARAQRQETNEPTGKTYVISGAIGVTGVTMQGLPRTPLTDEKGVYKIQVPAGWAGTVTPVKVGYRFDPPAKMYRNINGDFENEDYVASILPVTISGNVGLAGVRMVGLPGVCVTDAKGNYSVQVEYVWRGTVTPKREGYRFVPERRIYHGITKDFSDEDYRARILTHTISGVVGTGGVRIQGLPGNVVSASPDGRYSATVPYGWRGKVSPKKDGCVFEPASRDYPAVTMDLRSEDYGARPDSVVISDLILMDGERPVSGVTVTSEPGGASDVTDSQGRYTIRVPYGWTGSLRLAKKEYEFPEPLCYTNVTHHLVDGKRSSAFDEPVIPAPRASALRPQSVLDAGVAEVLVIPGSQVDPETWAQTREDMQVMLEILREKLSEPRTILGVLYDYGDFFGGSRDAQAIHWDGHAVLFVMRVDFPLSFGAEPPAGDEPAQGADPVWQRAREKLYSPRDTRRYGRAGTLPGADEMSSEQFQKDLVETLRHAANIRHVDPNEQIVLTIIGQEEPSRVPGHRGSYGSAGGAYGGADLLGASPVRGQTGRRRTGRRPSSPAPTAVTVLTIQAPKADVDAFAKGETTLEQFRQHVKIFSY